MKTAIITGDIINSRKLEAGWLDKLKTILATVAGKTKTWEIFRGDSFQIETPAEDALLDAIYIKAAIKSIKNADVRMGIGIDEQEIKPLALAEQNGLAFYKSGSAFDRLKQDKINLAIQTPNKAFDEDFNTMLKLALIIMDNWGAATAEVVKYAIENNNPVQAALAKITGKSQSSVSEALKRAHYTEIMALENLFRNKIKQLN